MKKLAVLISALAILLAACGDKESKETSSSSSSEKSSSDDKVSSSLDAKKAEKKKKPELKNNAVEIKGVKIKVLSTEVLPAGTEKFQEKPVIIVKYAVTNNSTEGEDVKAGMSWRRTFEVYQDQKDSEQKLDTEFLSGDKFQAAEDKQDDNIKKGATIETMEIYELKNETDPVLLKARDRDIYEGDNHIGTIKVNIKDAKTEKSKKDDKKEKTTEL
ncbi:DUF5067 domain-containing protein [Staphylococcus debuckii]|uniref:DUF5067 domain-containing protein n=1 Tax=Staphylococcus debuckii TaxID=2044912 RepID=UPI000F430734|nr:DUF5067 domain-containing protein [Staphylococcus debuckii]AYU54035.1 DUF5067 domain-containing protein [Staphylococcus debuckii]